MAISAPIVRKRVVGKKRGGAIATQFRAWRDHTHRSIEKADQAVLAERARTEMQGEELLDWVRREIALANPWEILERSSRVLNGPMCDQAQVMLLEEARNVIRTAPQAAGQLPKMASFIISKARLALSAYQEMARANGRAKKKDRINIPPELRPAETYRRFGRSLRWLRDHGFPANRVLRDLMREQTIPFEELDAPHWIDRYTSTLDPLADKPGEIRVRITTPVVDNPVAVKMAQDLGWDEKTVRDFLAAQEGFNQEDGLERILEAVDEDALGRLDDRKPQWMEMQEDCHPSRDLPSIRAEAKHLIKAGREKIDALVKEANEEIDMADPYWRGKFVRYVREGFRTSHEADDLIAFLNEKAEEGAVAADLGVLFLSFQHGYGFTEEDAERVRLHQVPNFRDLHEWLDFWGDELLEAMGDSPWRWKEISTEDLESFVDDTIHMIGEANNDGSTNIFRTRAFMEGYIRAMVDAHQITKVVDGKRHDLALEAGWESYRQWKSPAGASAYRVARSEGKEQKEAMAEFWKIVRREEKAIATGTVVKPTTEGLVLNTGRLISYRIALIKLQNGELHFPGDTRSRIKAALGNVPAAAEFASAL